jgi:hypothetical protein
MPSAAQGSAAAQGSQGGAPAHGEECVAEQGLMLRQGLDDTAHGEANAAPADKPAAAAMPRRVVFLAAELFFLFLSMILLFITIAPQDNF